jgi:mercuric ion binding protein
MKHLKILLLLAGLSAAAAANATTIEMTVNGLVCGFCAQGIEKTLRKDPATDEVFVSLEHRLVAVATKPDADITDDTLREALKDSGYDVVAITRTERPIATIRGEHGAKR